jgi:hypothetical protein
LPASIGNPPHPSAVAWSRPNGSSAIARPSGRFERIVQSWDTANKAAAWDIVCLTETCLLLRPKARGSVRLVISGYPTWPAACRRDISPMDGQLARARLNEDLASSPFVIAFPNVNGKYAAIFPSGKQTSRAPVEGEHTDQVRIPMMPQIRKLTLLLRVAAEIIPDRPSES